jgi:hypothetical protein
LVIKKHRHLTVLEGHDHNDHVRLPLLGERLIEVYEVLLEIPEVRLFGRDGRILDFETSIFTFFEEGINKSFIINVGLNFRF